MEGVTEKLCAAAFRGDLPMVNDLIHTVDSKDKNGVNSRGQTAIYCAARQGHEEIVKLLLDEGVDANKQDNHGSTPLHAASFWEHVNVVSLLLSSGCNTEIKNHAAGENKGLTAFQEARGKSRMVWQSWNDGRTKALAKAGYPVYRRAKKDNEMIEIAASFVKARSSLNRTPGKKKKDIGSTRTLLSVSQGDNFYTIFSEIPPIQNRNSVILEDTPTELESSDFEFTDWDEKSSFKFSQTTEKEIIKSPFSEMEDITTLTIVFGNNESVEILYSKEGIVEHLIEYLSHHPKFKEFFSNSMSENIKLYTQNPQTELNLRSKLNQYEDLSKGILLTKTQNSNPVLIIN